MIDYHDKLLTALSTVLPTHYEMILHSKIPTPCISFMETNNYVEVSGETLGYSRITYQVKVWSSDIEEIQKYVLMIDAVLRPLGFKRTSSNELYDNNSSMIQKILTYEALASENY